MSTFLRLCLIPSRVALNGFGHDFRYTVAVGEGSAEVCGAITVRGHYFENGNIQLQTAKEVPAKTITFSVREVWRAASLPAVSSQPCPYLSLSLVVNNPHHQALTQADS